MGVFIQWHVVVVCIGMRWLCRHSLTSCSCFQTYVLATFVDIICIYFYMHFPYSTCHCSEYKLLAFQVRISEESQLKPTTQQFITAKIPGCALKQGSKTHSSIRQSNFQLQNEAALISCRIRSVEHRSVWMDGLTHTPVCKIESC